MNILLITPPLTQLNTPYPATTVLKAFLKQEGYEVRQVDLGIELIHKLFHPSNLERVFDLVKAPKRANTFLILSQRKRYVACIQPVLDFLMGNDNTLAPAILSRNLLPEAGRFDQLTDLEWSFGTSGVIDQARYLATLFVEDLADFVREEVNPHFDLIRYAEQISSFATTFDDLDQALQETDNIVDELMISILEDHLNEFHPQVVGFSVPFPGCLYGGLKCAKFIKEKHPEVVTNMGGGFPNTEWRHLNEPKIFDYIDYINLDDGELPMLKIMQHIEGKIGKEELLRTYYRNQENHVVYSGNDERFIPFEELPVPDFSDLKLNKYLDLSDIANPMQRLWSVGRWNKMMMSHGCYWAKCAFCDTCLDYIGRYDAPTAKTVVDRMERIISQTGNRGFHFVDEALSPKLLKEVSEEILRRGLIVTFWGNIRFEKAYTSELCNLLSKAGCIAVSGGLEVASNRLLKLINKGVTIEQTMEASRNFTRAGIMVHTYLMYGFPTETLSETVSALDVVRKMFEEGIVQSAFWHRYAMTCHSPSGRNPEEYFAVRTSNSYHPFCNNEVDWDNSPNSAMKSAGSQFNYDIEAVGRGLYFATYNYMNGVGFDEPLQRWFDIKIPDTKGPQSHKTKKHHHK